MHAAMAAVLALLTGCAAAPRPTAIQDMQTIAHANAQWGHVRDLRGEYRQALCPRLTASSDCEEVLLRFPGEPAALRNASTSPSGAQRYQIAFVPGLFADCAEPWVAPFSDVVEDLRLAGFETLMLRVAGRAGTEQNAAQLVREIAALPDEGKRLIVFAYSKGLPDMLDVLLRYPQARARIAAVVSYAGAFNGSPLADDFIGVYSEFIARLPLKGCASGTGAELDALRPEVRQSWWQAHHHELRAAQIPFFSLVGAPLPDRVSPMLRSNHARLAQHDVNNDGQLLARDAVVPGSALLGFVNADHWAMAIPLTRQLPALAALFRDDVPRSALVKAAIEVVDKTLNPSPTPRHQP